MAQMVERVLGKDEVTGSIPVSSSKKSLMRKHWGFLLITFSLFTKICIRDFWNVRSNSE